MSDYLNPGERAAAAAHATRPGSPSGLLGHLLDAAGGPRWVVGARTPGTDDPFVVTGRAYWLYSSAQRAAQALHDEQYAKGAVIFTKVLNLRPVHL